MTSELRYKSGLAEFWRNNRLFLLAIFFFTAALVYRRADAFTNPQFWAEDGMVFFMVQDHHPEFIPFENYNGYIHLIPRTVAYVAKVVQIPLESVPAFYNYVTYLICLFFLSLLWRFLSYNQLTKFLMIVSIGVLPIANEVYMNLTNVQWFSGLGLILLFFDLRLKSIYDLIILSVAVFFAGLTGPFSVMFAPLILWKCWKHRKNLIQLLPCILAILTGLVQFIFLYTHFHGRLFPNLPVPENHLMVMFYNAIKQTFLLDHRMLTEFRTRHLLVIVPLVLTFVGLLIWSFKRRKEINILLLLCIGLNIFFTVKANWPFEWLMSPFLGGMRYYFLPFTLSFWFMLIQIRRIPIAQICIFTGLVALFFAHKKWVRSSFLDLKWKQEVAEYKTKGDLIIPINPLGWYVILRKK